MKAVKRICAFIIGLVLFIAGLLKLMDPVGAGLVVEEYFKFLHLGFLIPVSKAVGNRCLYADEDAARRTVVGISAGRWHHSDLGCRYK